MKRGSLERAVPVLITNAFLFPDFSPFFPLVYTLLLKLMRFVTEGGIMGMGQQGSNVVGVTMCVGMLLWASVGRAELKPGEVLDQTRWQEAQGMMPEAILRRFANGQHISQVITLPPEAVQYGSRFRQLTEANHGKYAVNDRGVLTETSTGTWPQYRPGGFPFPVIEQSDPQAAHKIIYNFASRGGPVDDIEVLLNIFWVSEKSLNRYVDFVGRLLPYESRWFGPIPNPDETSGKSLGYGVNPYVVLPLREGNDIRVNVGLDPQLFTYQGLTRLGK
jgi:hypothetical protein